MMKVSKELCEFTGAIIGDGNLWTDGSRYRVEIAGDTRLDLTYFLHLSKIAYNLFKKHPYKFRVKGNQLYFRLQSKYAFNILNKGLGIFAGRGKSRTVIIPKSIIKKGWRYSKWALRGIMDTDGTLFFSRKTYKKAIYPSIEIRTFSRNLGIQVNGLLWRNGFRSHLRGNEDRGYSIGIYGETMLRKWVREIGFSNQRHGYKYLAHKAILAESAAVAQPGRASR